MRHSREYQTCDIANANMAPNIPTSSVFLRSCIHFSSFIRVSSYVCTVPPPDRSEYYY